MNKTLQKIRAVIYYQKEGRFSKEEGFEEIEKIMDIHNQLNNYKEE